MGSDDETGAGYSTLPMRWRVGMQGLTVALMALNFVLTGAEWYPPNGRVR